jgi:hypothetical protein
MRTAIIKFSDDNKEFTLVASGEMDTNAPGLLGGTFDLEATGRYVRIEVEGQVGAHAGIGEVEIYTVPITQPPTSFLAKADIDGAKAAYLTWKNPPSDGFQKIRVMRNELKKEGSLSNFPSSPEEGTMVYEGTAEEFVDENDDALEAGLRYFYSAFSYHSDSGWSLVVWSAVDSCLVAPINANIALYKPVVSTLDVQCSFRDSNFVLEDATTSSKII